MKNLVLMRNFLSVGFFLLEFVKKDKNVRILSAIRFICILQEIKEWEIWSVIGYLLLSLHDELSYDNPYLQRSLR